MAWYNTNWLYRVKITVDYTKVKADLTDYPLYISLADLPADFHTNVKAAGADIRVTQADGTTELPREVVFYDAATDTGELHIKTNLSDSEDTELYIYYGNSSATEPATDATYGSENVWSSNYSLVYHLQQDPSGSAPQILDSTTNDYDGTSSGSMTSGDLVSGKLAGKGIDFDGSNDYIQAATFKGISGASQRTVQAWVKTSTGSGNQHYLEWGLNNNGERWTNKIDTGGLLRTEVQGGYNIATTNNADGNFRLLHAVLPNGSNNVTQVLHYVNGSANASTSSSSRTINTSNSTNYVLVGGSTMLSRYFVGILDEVRILNVALTATWIETEYNNQNSPNTFYEAGIQELGSLKTVSAKARIKKLAVTKTVSAKAVHITDENQKHGVINNESGNSWATVCKKPATGHWYKQAYQVFTTLNGQTNIARVKALFQFSAVEKDVGKIYCKIYTDSGSNTPDTLVATAVNTLEMANVKYWGDEAPNYTIHYFYFAKGMNLSPETKYIVTVEPDESYQSDVHPSDLNIFIQTTNPYSGGQFGQRRSTDYGSSWSYVTSSANDAYFSLSYWLEQKEKTVAAKARIKAITTKTVAAKASIAGATTTETKTVATKARIEKAGVSKTASAKARIEQTNAKTTQAKARVEQQLEKTTSAKARVKKTEAKTVATKATIKATTARTVATKARIASTGVVKTVAPKARIEQTESKTASAKARIEQSEAKTVSTKARIEKTEAKTATAKATIKTTTTKTTSAKARIVGTGATKTTSAKARIRQLAVTKTAEAKARIEHIQTVTTAAKARIEQIAQKTTTAKARVEATTTKTTATKARIATTGVVKSIEAKARVKKTEAKTVQAKARIEKTLAKTTQALARIELVSQRTTNARARIETTTTATTTAKARIQRVEAVTTTAKTRIEKTATKTIQTKARIQHTRTKTVQTKARIQKTLAKTTTTKARVQKTLAKTTTAKAKIVNTYEQTVAVKARIATTGLTKAVAAKARIQKTNAKTVGAKANIQLVKTWYRLLTTLWQTKQSTNWYEPEPKNWQNVEK